MTKGIKYRLGVKLIEIGVRRKMYWIMRIGYKIKEWGMGDYI